MIRGLAINKLQISPLFFSSLVSSIDALIGESDGPAMYRELVAPGKRFIAPVKTQGMMFHFIEKWQASK
jgi:hypothetical protein